MSEQLDAKQQDQKHAEIVLDFLCRLATCHNCGCDLIVDFGCRHCHDGCPSQCDECEDEHAKLTNHDYEAALSAARQLVAAHQQHAKTE